MPSTDTAKSFCGPSPAANRNTADEEDAHAVVAQVVTPNRIDGVTSSDPKLIPDTVTLYPADAAALISEMKLAEGAAHRRNTHASNCNPFQYRGAHTGPKWQHKEEEKLKASGPS